MAQPLHVVGNVIRSFLLIGFLFGLFFGLVFAGTWLVQGALLHFNAELDVITARAVQTMAWLTPYVIAGGCVWILVALAFAGYMIRWSSDCRIVEPGTQPRLEGILKRLCEKAGMDVPKLGIIESDKLNAYATGLFKRDRLVAVTAGLAGRLDDAEVEAVMAHELAHIRHRDVMLMVIAGTVAGGIALLAQLLYFAMTRTICLAASLACGDEEGESIGAWVSLLLGFILVLLASFISTLIRFALSRSREYLADAGAAEMTGNPRALITALEKISGDCDIGAPSAVMQMCIDRPRSWIDLFSTHPRAEDRISALRALPQRASPVARGRQDCPVRRLGNVPVPTGLVAGANFGQRGR